MKILLDNGHGVDTPGKRSPDGRLREYAYAREIATRLQAMLTEHGYDCERIVTETNDIPLSDRSERVNRICRRIGKKNVILISIHCNAAGMGNRWMKARGWCAYTSRGQTESDTLADYLYDSAEKALQGQQFRKDLSDGDPDWEAGFWILRKTLCPAVLTENLFQDNKNDVAYLLSEEGKQSIVDLHYNGIVAYLKATGNA